MEIHVDVLDSLLITNAVKKDLVFHFLILTH